MDKFIEFIGGFPNGLGSQMSLQLLFVFVGMFLTIGITQLLKNRNHLYSFRTEWLSIIVSVTLYMIYYVLYLTLPMFVKPKFVWYELLYLILQGIVCGVISSVVAEKLFKQKK